MDNAGIEEQIANLSYAEKRLVIVASLLQQVSEANNDWGRTIESVSNQTRILNEQWQRLTRAVGNVFLPILKTVLPYLNAVLMVLVEIISAIATLVGYNESDFDFFTDVDESVVDLSDDLSSASDSAAALKSGLRGFDKLNVITTPSSSSSGSGSGAGTGISADVMDLFNNAVDEYNSKLTDVQMKATKIRDSIMEWLGFTKEINPLTGEVSFKYQGIKTTLKNMWTWFKKLSPQGKILVSILAGLFTKNMITLASKFIGLLGKTGLYKWATSLISPLKSLYKNLVNINFAETTLTKGISSSINSWASQLTLMDRMKVTLVGAGGLVLSLQLTKKAMEDVSNEGWNLKNGLEAGLGVLGSAASGAIIGSQFGIYGTIIGGVAGAAWSLYDAFMSYPTSVSKATDSINESLKSINSYNDSLKEQYTTIKNSAIANQSLQTSYSSLVTELENITDENGKVKEGYEDRAQFIITTLNNAYGLEMEMIDGVIQSYKSQIQAVKDVILEKRKEIALESAEEAYKVAINEKVDTYKNYTEAVKENVKAIKNQKEAQDNYNKAYDDYLLLTMNGTTINVAAQNQLKKAREELENANTTLENSKTTLSDATEAYDSNVKAISTYTGLLAADTQENADLVEQYINDIENSYYDGTQYISLSYEEQLDDAAYFYARTLKLVQDEGGEINDEVFSQAEQRLNSLNTNLSDMTNSLKGNMGDNVIDAWGTLANTSESKFIDEFSKLDSDIQQNVVDKMYDKGYKISDELQNGINKINPTIKVTTDTSKANKSIKITADTSEAQKSTSSFWDRLKSAFSKTFGMTIGALTFANGGMPEVGQLFVANENGPELVGQIGGQSFVANQNQMMDLLDKKIGNAQNGSQQQVFNIYLDENHKLGTYTINQLQDMAKSNGKPIKIG